MPTPVLPPELSLSGIAHRCKEETDRFFGGQSYDPSYCYELFRRAIEKQNQGAYERLYLQYQPLVASWVEHHPSFPATGEEAAYFVNRAFEKMWRALSTDRFGQFSDLKSLLRYLKLCAHSVVIDHARAAKQRELDGELPPTAGDRPAGRSSVEETAIDQSVHEEFWFYVNERLSSDKERLVLYGSFVLDLKPRELADRYAGVFSNVSEVYRTKQNLLERLRRDDELRRLLTERA